MSIYGRIINSVYKTGCSINYTNMRRTSMVMYIFNMKLIRQNFIWQCKILNFLARFCMGNRKRYAKFHENIFSTNEIKSFLSSTFANGLYTR